MPVKKKPRNLLKAPRIYIHVYTSVYVFEYLSHLALSGIDKIKQMQYYSNLKCKNLLYF